MDAKKAITMVVGIAAILAAAFVFLGGNPLPGKGEASGDIVINKSEITDQAKFFGYKAGDVDMEVLAVKAEDGSIRTAFNTCQICYSSGRGYYVQEDDELVCQNCGNRFNTRDVEVIRGGCNPVPILKENKTEDETKIVVPKSFLRQNKELFTNWR